MRRAVIAALALAAFLPAASAVAAPKVWYWSEARAESAFPPFKKIPGKATIIVGARCTGVGASTYSSVDDTKLYNRFRCVVAEQVHKDMAKYDAAVAKARATAIAAKAGPDHDAYVKAHGDLLEAEAKRAQYEAHGTPIQVLVRIRVTGRFTYVVTH